MNEESDGMNENENNSEVVILPERSHMEELLISDQSQLREEQNSYERKLDEKLRDLGLYEDDMTINQKEELLAVVVISCETAEQEENKRQVIRDYLEGAQSLEGEIEFSYQESAWLAGEANLLCSTVTQVKEDDASPNTKIVSSFMDSEASTSKIRNFESLSLAEKAISRNSPDIFEDEMTYTDTAGDVHSVSSESPQKRSLRPRSFSKSERRAASSTDADVKIAIAHPIIQEHDDDKAETTEILDRQLSFQREKLLLDKSMSCWRPCSSPKDKPLSDFRLNQNKEEDVSAATLQEKFKKSLTLFEKIACTLKPKKSFAPKIVQLSKPYSLMHQGSVAKKVTKLDNYDYIIGVSEKNQNDEENEENFTPCDETLTRTKSAFHRVKPLSQGKLASFSDRNSPIESVKVTRSGATYGSKRFKSDHDVSESPPEIILDDSCNQSMPSTSKDNFVPEKHVTFNEGMIIQDCNNKLPKFSDLRPDVTKCKMIVPSPISQKDNTLSNSTVKSNCDLNVSSSVKKIQKGESVANRSVNDFSSNSSSPLIDVETVVDDDEIEQFVYKRKLAPSSHKSINAKNPSKRLKKSES